jgi:acetophenone carboxylase
VALQSVAVGGGSVVSLVDGEVRLGPESMGAYPGPAAYGFGSQRATLVDALLVAGMMNPDRFLGGRRRLRTELGEAALRADVAEPLGVDIDRAAQLVLDSATDRITSVVRELVGPQAVHSPLFAFGGNGANLAAAVAQAVGSERAVVFRLGPVFSAFGSSVSQVKHVAEAWPSGSEAADPRALNELVERLRERVLLDVAGEGFDTKDVTVEVELLVDGRRTSVGPGPNEIAKALSAGGEDRSSGGVAVTARPVEQVTVTATAPVPRYEPPRLAGKSHVPSSSDTRGALFAGGREETGIYDWDRLEAGARVKGPAILEGAANTCTVPPAWELEVDGYGNGILRRTR